MKFKISAIAVIMILITACDAPRNKRAVRSNVSQRNILDTGSSSSGTQPDDSLRIDGGDSSSDRDDGSNVTGEDRNSSLPADLRHCNWSFDGETGFDEYSNAHLGPHTICQSTSNNQDIWIQLKNPITNRQVCFIPTHSQTPGGSSIYIGEPRCRFLNEGSKLFKVSVFNNRRGYSNLEINGVMVMKDEPHFYKAPYNRNLLSPDAYLYCMEYLQTYNDSAYCSAFAREGHYAFEAFPEN